jgi:plastocyanin
MNDLVRSLVACAVLGLMLMAGITRSNLFNTSAQGATQVTITNFKFEPKTLTVNEGDTVTWNNKEGLHTVKSDTDAFVSKNLKAGESFSYQFTKAGKYPYHCAFHGSKGGGDMAGTIIVKKK